MNLSTLLPRLHPRSVDGPTDRPIRGVSHDSREVGAQDIFVAITGAKVDGRSFAPGLDVAAVICEKPVTVRPGVTVIQVSDARAALAASPAAKALVGKLREAQEVAHKGRLCMWRYGDVSLDSDDE